MKESLTKWLTPILAIITAVLESGHLAHLFDGETIVLIAAIATAVAGIVAAMTKPSEPEPTRFPPPPPAQQQPRK